MRTLLAWLALVSCLVVVGPAGEALSCSCAIPDPSETLARADGAFVGTLLERPTEPMGDDFGGVWVFEVEEWVKGDLGAQVGVHSALDGAACGFELAEGDQAGVFIYNDNGRPVGGLCDTTTPEALLAANQPVVFDGEGPPVFLVAGSAGRTRLATLDSAGRLLHAVGDGRSGWSVSICPGDERFAEVSDGTVFVRSMDDLSVIREVSQEQVEEVWCLDETGERLVVRIYLNDRPTLRELPGGEVLYDENFSQQVVNRTHAATVRLNSDHLIDVTDLSDGTTTTIDTGSGSIGSVFLHSDLPRLVITKTEFPPNGSYRTVASVYDLATATIIWQSDPLENTDVYGFIDATRLMGARHPIEAELPETLVIDIETGTVDQTALRGWEYFQTESGIVSNDNGTLLLTTPAG